MLRTPPPLPRRARGAIAIMLAVMLIVMIGIIGLAIDLSRLYNRKVELQTVADSTALAAARRLAGSAAGIDAAVAAAAAAADELKVNYGHQDVAWSPQALSFSDAPSGSVWLDAASARVAPAAIAFVRVDTAPLGAAMSMIDTYFMRIVGDGMDSASAAATAVAGRASIKVTPFALCAMSSQEGHYRTLAGDLLQYGFRRGVGYDLMQLNPHGATPENFVVNPIDAGAASGSSGNTAPAIVGPFVCAGTMPMVNLAGGQVKLSRPFPLAALYQHLNSRFDQYNGGACDVRAAPPDVNIKSFVYNTSVGWMKSATPGQQTARSTSASPLRTIADLEDDSANAAPMYGPLWTFARPVPYGAWALGVPEPVAGYAPFALSAWAGLYGPAKPEPKTNYPAATPYGASGGANFAAPASAHGLGQKYRRVLHVPLLDCPVAAGSNTQASVLAVGKFFMTVPATATSISAEFAGLATDDALSGAVELFK